MPFASSARHPHSGWCQTPGNLAQGIINTTKQIVQTSTTAKNTLDGFMEAQKIFQQGKNITMRSKRCMTWLRVVSR